MQRCVYPIAQYQGVPRWLGRASYPIDYRQLYSKRTKKNEISKAVRRSEGEKKTLKSPKDGIEEISEKMDNQKIFMEHFRCTRHQIKKMDKIVIPLKELII